MVFMVFFFYVLFFCCFFAFFLIIFRDVGGDAKGRDLWRHYIKNAQAIVFVLDASDEKRLDGQGSFGDEQHGM